MKRIILYTFIFILYLTTFTYAQDLAFDKLDIAGNNFLVISQRIGRWVVTVMCLLEIIRCALSKDRSGVGNAIVTFVMIYGAMFFVPYIMDITESIFK